MDLTASWGLLAMACSVWNHCLFQGQIVLAGFCFTVIGALLSYHGLTYTRPGFSWEMLVASHLVLRLAWWQS